MKNPREIFAGCFTEAAAEYYHKRHQWIQQLKSQGVKAAHPDDGWVNRFENYVVLCYPYFDQGVESGDTIALGNPDKFRFVCVTSIKPNLLGGNPRYYFFELPSPLTFWEYKKPTQKEKNTMKNNEENGSRESTLEEEIASLCHDSDTQNRIFVKLDKRLERERVMARVKAPISEAACEGKATRNWEADFKHQAEEIQKLQFENRILKASCVSLAIALAPDDFAQTMDSTRILKMAMNSIYGRSPFKSEE